VHLFFTVLALVTAGLAAVRSSWSPCGRSMLSTITPLAERGRGNSYAATCAWFITGALAGGACLGGVLGGLAAATAPLSPAVAAALATCAGAAAAASDARLGGFVLPFHRRQVNELWLDRFRSWVYGAGFGWQIGTGFATYVVTAGLYLMVPLAALSGSPLVGFCVGLVFGAVRGLAVVAGRRITDTSALVAFHRRFDQVERWARASMIGWEAILAVATLGAWGALVFGASYGALGAALSAAFAAALSAVRTRRAVVLALRKAQRTLGRGARVLDGPSF